jgi:diguanylate cyclase (GGDEF)-like protein/PAS domain S-box-containing protein
VSERDGDGTEPRPASSPRAAAEPAEPDYAFMRQSATGMILRWDDTMERRTGWERADVLNRNGLDLVHPADRVAAVDSWFEMLAKGRSKPRRWRRLRKDGGYDWNEVTLENRLDDLDGPDGGCVVLRVLDVSEDMARRVSEARSGEDEARMPRHATIHQTHTGEILQWGPRIERMTGWSPDDVLGRSGLDLLHPEDKAVAIDAWVEMLEDGRACTRRWRARRRDGTYQWHEVTIENLLGHSAHGYVRLDVVDVTDETAARDALEAQELLLNRLTQVVPMGLFQVERDLRIVYANERLHHLLGTGPAADLVDQLARVVPTDRPEVIAAVKRVLQTGEDEDVAVDVRPPAGADGSGEPRRCLFNIRPLPDRLGTVTSAIACVSDVTETARRLVELEMDLIHHAFEDPLTGLANRTQLLNRVDEAISQSRQSGDVAALLLVDLDEFKAVNDAMGLAVGDDLLRALGDRLRALSRPADVVARVGSDVFAVLMEDYLDPDHPRRTAEQVLTACAQPFEIDGRPLRVAVSIGIATSSHTPGREELLRDADLALHRAKAAGRGGYEIFEPEMHEAAVARVELDTSLRQAIDDNQLLVVYQPIHDLATGVVTSVEALVRWRHPTRGMVSPADFIPLAEATGLIVPIGRWVLGQACRQAARWAASPALGPKVSVNLSARQLTAPELLDDVTTALSRSGLPPDRLVLEITESVLMEHTDTNVELLADLRALGVSLAIDDFGTGYSSLAYLERLPVDTLKIDKAFVDRVADGGRHAKLINGILKLSHDLGLLAVAEGIETDEQLRALKVLSCPQGQGYLFSRPVEGHLIDAYLVAGLPKARRNLSTSDERALVALAAHRVG